MGTIVRAQTFDERLKTEVFYKKKKKCDGYGKERKRKLEPSVSSLILAVT